MKKKIKIKTPEDMAFKIVQDMYDRLAAKMVVAVYRERDRAVKEVARKYKIDI